MSAQGRSPAELPLTLRAHVVALFVLAYFVVAARLPGGITRLHLACGLGYAALLQLGYLANKLYDRQEDAYNGELLTVPGSAGGWRAALSAAFLAVCALMWASAPRLAPVLVYSAAAAFAYSHPAVRLKGYPLVKPLVNTVNFFLVSVMSPALLAGAGWQRAPLLLAASHRLLLIVLCLTVLFDVRDLEGDRRAGLTTIPGALGRERTLAAVILLSLASGLAGLAAGNAVPGAAQLTVAAFAAGALQKERGRRYYDALALIEAGFLLLML